MTSELAQLTTVLDAVYDAALDVALWPLAIERAAAFVRCTAGMVAAYDVMHRGVSFRIPWGYEQKYLDTFDYYASINPMLRASFAFKVGQVASIADIMPFEEFRKYPTYTEWAKPQGIGDVVQAVLEKSPVALSVLALSRHEREGPVNAETRRRMALIIPHFRRSVLIGKLIDLAKIEAATFRNAVDGLAAAVFLVSRSARLVHANVQGAKMLAAGDPLRLADGTLTAVNVTVQRNLALSLREAAGEQPASTTAVQLVAADGSRYVAHVLPMTSGRRAALISRDATAALFVRRVDRRFPEAVEAMRRIYGLTPSETRVLHVLMDVGGTVQAALSLRLTDNTVKTHLRHIFAKTGARSQVDLVKLAAGLASPFDASRPGA